MSAADHAIAQAFLALFVLVEDRADPTPTQLAAWLAAARGCVARGRAEAAAAMVPGVAPDPELVARDVALALVDGFLPMEFDDTAMLRRHAIVQAVVEKAARSARGDPFVVQVATARAPRAATHPSLAGGSMSSTDPTDLCSYDRGLLDRVLADAGVGAPRAPQPLPYSAMRGTGATPSGAAALAADLTAVVAGLAAEFGPAQPGTAVFAAAVREVLRAHGLLV